MKCACCGQPIKEGQQYVTRDIEAGSGPGAIIRLHLWCRPDPATQPRSYPRQR